MILSQMKVGYLYKVISMGNLSSYKIGDVLECQIQTPASTTVHGVNRQIYSISPTVRIEKGSQAYKQLRLEELGLIDDYPEYYI